MTSGQPRWLTPGEVSAAARVIRDGYGGSLLKHWLKVALVPHLTTHGHAAVLGVGADHGRRDLSRRIVDSVVHATWMLSGAKRSQDSLPWVLRPAHTTGWRLINLAKNPQNRSATHATIALAAHIFDLADQTGTDTTARVDTDRSRLAEAYTRRGFRIVSAGDGVLNLYRTALGHRQRTDEHQWTGVLRTGRLTLTAWQSRFGRPRGPFLDLGAGDSALGAQLTANDIFAVSLDPSYAVRPSSHGGTAVAAVAERLPFRDASFATVNANFVLQHVQRPRRALTECLRAVRSDGQLVLHPVWASRPFRNHLDRLPGVQVRAGKVMPPRRQRPSMILSPDEFDVTAHGAAVTAALRPHPVVGWLGRAAMRMVILANGRACR